MGVARNERRAGGVTLSTFLASPGVLNPQFPNYSYPRKTFCTADFDLATLPNYGVAARL